MRPLAGRGWAERTGMPEYCSLRGWDGGYLALTNPLAATSAPSAIAVQGTRRFDELDTAADINARPDGGRSRWSVNRADALDPAARPRVNLDILSQCARRQLRAWQEPI